MILHCNNTIFMYMFIGETCLPLTLLYTLNYMVWYGNVLFDIQCLKKGYDKNKYK